MVRRFRIAAICLAATTTVVATLAGGAYFATQRVRPFYERAVELDSQILEQGSRELESRATALYSDARQTGRWQATFTAEQINGWMARQQADGHFPEKIAAPRVAFSDGIVTLGFRTSRGNVDTVVSVDAAVLLTEAGEVAVRLTSVQAGALPIPVMHVANEIAAACRELDLPVRWTQTGGQPVALIGISSPGDSTERRITLDTIELREGTLLIAGETEEAMSDER